MFSFLWFKKKKSRGMHGTVSVCVWWGCCCTLLIVFRDVVIVSVRLTQLSFPASSVRRSVWFPKMKLCEISRSLYKKLRVFLIAFFRVDALHTFVGNVRLFHLAGVHVWIRNRRWEEVYFVLCFFFIWDVMSVVCDECVNDVKLILPYRVATWAVHTERLCVTLQV